MSKNKPSEEVISTSVESSKSSILLICILLLFSIFPCNINLELLLLHDGSKRNRIITALSEGILVIEAGYRSGTSITAKHAKEQGKKVFAIPGRTDCNVGIGVNELIKKGAILTTNIEDILKYYPEFAQKVKRVKKNYNKKYEKIVNILEEGEKSMQELINLSNMKVYELFLLISNMEIENIIFKNYFGKYALVKL